MADIFVSYAHVDQGPVKAIVGELERQGLTVWWDIAMRAGDAYTDVIETELENAKCVLAVWSRNARNSTWVKAESSLANDAGKLVQVVLQKDVRPPLPFNIIHYESLESGANNQNQDWLDLVAAIRGRIGGAAAERAPTRTPNPIDGTAILSALSAVGLGIYLAAPANLAGVGDLLQRAPEALRDPTVFPLYAAAAFGAGAAVLALKNIAALAGAGR